MAHLRGICVHATRHISQTSRRWVKVLRKTLRNTVRIASQADPENIPGTPLSPLVSDEKKARIEDFNASVASVPEDIFTLVDWYEYRFSAERMQQLSSDNMANAVQKTQKLQAALKLSLDQKIESTLLSTRLLSPFVRSIQFASDGERLVVSG